MRVPTFFEDGGIMTSYRQTSVIAIQRKVTKTEKTAKNLFDAPLHQPRGDAADETLQIFADVFFSILVLSRLRNH